MESNSTIAPYEDYSAVKVKSTQEYKTWWRNVIKTYYVGTKSIPVSELSFLEINANVMSEEKMSRLSQNIEYDGMVTQLPLVHKLPNGKYEIISGNHRVKGSISAGLESVDCLTFECRIPKDEKIRLEVSHNTVRGNPLENILADIMRDMDNTDMVIMSGADFATESLKFDKADFTAIDENPFEFRDISLVFTPVEESKVAGVINFVETNLKNNSSLYILPRELYDGFLDMIIKTKADFKIKSNAIALGVMLDFCEANYDKF